MLRQAAVWELQDKAGGRGTAPAAAQCCSAGCAGCIGGAQGARGGGKAAVEASVGALSVGVAGGSAGNALWRRLARRWVGGIGGGEGDGGRVLLSVPLAGVLSGHEKAPTRANQAGGLGGVWAGWGAG